MSRQPPPWETALLNIDLVKWAFNTPTLFRYFDLEEHADAFTAGCIYISTLGKCRATEDQMRGDSGEGTLHYSSGSISGPGSDPRVQEVARRSGIHIESGDAQVTVSLNDRISATPDAYVLCLSMEFSERLMKKFGSYCVEIDNALRFFEELTYVMSICHRLEREAPLREVSYGPRSYTHLDPPPRDVGFLKPERFREEREVRCIWIPRDHQAQPHLLCAPELAGRSKRLA